MAYSDDEEALQNAAFEEAFQEAVRRGMLTEARDEHGNVIMELDSNGIPQIVWERTPAYSERH